MTSTSETAPGARRLIGWRDVALFTALTVVPLVLGGRGRLNADTKQYLYLDPAGLLDRARSLWDPSLGGGTVSHQAIGYLWPMGPYYWASDAIGVPDWIAQRVWIGGIQLVAALGALALLRHLLPRHPAQLVGAGVYGLSPFVLGHVTGQSGLLLPFAALGWLALCVVRSVEEGGWKWPAAFALVVTTCGSLNGSSTFFVILGAVLWVPHAVVVTRRTSLRRGVAVIAKLGALTLVTQLWWLVAYAVGGRYGLPILAVTENVRTTSGTTAASEILRGLGYWFFYGRDKLGPWLDGLAPPYIEPALLVVSFGVPVVVLLLGGLVRWKHRAYFVALVVVGTLISIGAFPEPGSPFGTFFERISRSSDLVLSLRNTQRAAPLVILGFAGLIAASGLALHRVHARAAAAVMAALALLAAGSLPAQWRSGLIAERFHRHEVPQPWLDAAERLDASGRGRILELPGIDFASYRWGHTLDPVLTGLTDRDVMFRELVPAGGAPGASLLAALDGALQEYTLEPAAVAPVARLLGASDIVFRGDLEYERYRTARPRLAWRTLTSPDARLGEPVTFGDRFVNDAVATRPMIDEIELGASLNGDGGDGSPPQVAVLPVPGGGRTILSTRPAAGSTVVAGDGEGVLAAAAAGLLEEGERGPLLLAGTAAGAAVGPGARFIVTDSNRKRAGRWYSLRENVGATEPADAPVVLDDPSDARLDVTAGRGLDDRTVAEWRGARRIWANSYGNPFTLLPEDRPVNAFDGDPRTSWRLDMISRDDRPLLGITLDAPVTTDRITIVPVANRPGTTAPVRVRVTLDSTRTFEALAASAPEELTVPLDGQPFTTAVLEVLEWTGGGGPVGVAELTIPGVSVSEVLRLPTSTFEDLGAGAGTAPLAVVMSRHRANRAEVVRADPEPSMARSFSLHGDVGMRLRGTARLNAAARDELIDSLVGLPGAADGGFTARSSEHLAGSLAARAASAFDGDGATAWTTPFVGLVGQAIEVDAGRATTVDTVSIDAVVDDRHSTLTELRVSVDGGAPVTVAVPHAAGRHELTLPTTLSGRVFRFEIAGVVERTVTDWYTERPIALPVAVAEIALAGLAPRPLPPSFATACRSDLVVIDERPVALRLVGRTDAALAGGTIDLEVCDGAPLALGPGPHEVRTAKGLDTGVDVDRLVLTTPAWESAAAAPDDHAPSIEVDDAESRTRTTGRISTTGEPFWLVLDQSINDGWDLDIDGADARGPFAVDSFATGWLVTPDRPGELTARVRWAPQRTVNVALAISATGALACLVVVLAGRRRRSPRAERDRDVPDLAAWNERCRSSLATRAGIASAAAAVAAVFIHPVAAPAALGLAAIATWRPFVGGLLPGALTAVAAISVVAEQVRRDHRLDGEWPQWFATAHVLAALGVVVLAVSAASEAVRRRRPEHVEN